MNKQNLEQIEKNIRKCKNCGTEIYSVKEEFKCTKCGRLNKSEVSVIGKV